MIIRTYIDGNRRTRLGTLEMRHSPAVSVSIKKKDQAEWVARLGSFVEEEIEIDFVPPTDDDAPVPVTMSTSDLSDWLTNFYDPEDHDICDDWLKPYLEDLLYMTEEDPVGMGIVYVMGKW